MKILHYMLGLPPLHEGGLMIYARDLIYEQKEQGNDVSIIIPGRYNYFNHKSKIKYIQKISNIPIYFLNNPLPISFNGFQNPYSFISKRNTKNIFKYFKKNKFDILHIHSLIGLPKEFVEDAKSANVKIVFTSHDYFGLCPKINFYKYDDTDCLENYDIRNCVYCNENSFIFNIWEKIKRNIRLLFFIYDKKSLILKNVNKINNKFKRKNIRKNSKYKNTKHVNSYNNYIKWLNYEKEILKNIDLILFNSSISKNVFTRFIDIHKDKYKIIQITNKMIKDNRKIINYTPLRNRKIILTFLGGDNKIKGYFNLINVLNEIKKNNQNWELRIYGTDICDNSLDLKYFKFKGKYKHSMLKEIFEETSVLLMPSKWKETFGFVALEALSYGIPVILSDKVGIKDLIHNNQNGIIYNDTSNDIYLQETLINIINNPNILYNLHKNIINMVVNFDISYHVMQIIKYYNDLIKFK